MPHANTLGSTITPVGGNAEEPPIRQMTSDVAEDSQNKRSDVENSSGPVNSEIILGDDVEESYLCPDEGSLKSCEVSGNLTGDEKTTGSSGENESETNKDVNKAPADTCDKGNSIQKNRELIIKEVSYSSTAFIGPVCRPNANIENELSTFYQELEQIDSNDSPDSHSDGKNNTSETSKPVKSPSTREEESGRDSSHGYRPYHVPHSHAGPRRELWNPRKWRPHSHPGVPWNGSHPYNQQSQWQDPSPSGVPQNFPDHRFHFHGLPNHSSPRPPPFRLLGPCMYPLPNRALLNHYSNDTNWSALGTPPFPPGPDSTATGGYSDFDGHPGYRVEFPSYDTPHWSQPYNQQQNDSQRDSWQQYDSGQDSWQQYDSGQDSWQHYDSGQDSRQHYDSGQDSRQQYHGEEDQGHHENGASLKLILMRGAPGCGKSTLAKELLSTGPNGIILSTDDYFFQDGEYFFDPTLLGEAHGWNQNRAWKAIQEYRSPVIIDNTNIQAWEMKPYVVMALEKGYCITFHEPDTSWKFDPSQLERRNKHGVSREKIVKILESFERPMTVNIVLNSTEPPRRNKRHLSKNSI